MAFEMSLYHWVLNSFQNVDRMQMQLPCQLNMLWKVIGVLSTFCHRHLRKSKYPKWKLHGLKQGASEDPAEKQIWVGLDEAVQLWGAL